MQGGLNFLAQAVNQPRPQLLLATVSTSQPLPSAHTDPLYVVEPHAPANYIVIPAGQWLVGHGASAPAAGQPVLVLRDNYRNLWCIAP